jgi:glutathione transport system permease protein
MGSLLLRRFGHLVVVVLGISMITFLLIHLTGDPVTKMLPVGAGKEEKARFRVAMGFDRPLYVQYWRFVRGAVQGDFGHSLYTRQSAFLLVWQRLPATLWLTGAGLTIVLLIALPLGTMSAIRRDSVVDYLCTIGAIGGHAMPIFWLGLMLITLFAANLRWVPTAGYGGWEHLILPGITLGAFQIPITACLVRSRLRHVLQQDYVRTAQAKGLTEWAVLLKHVLKNVGIPLIALVGLQCSRFLGGIVITEAVFSWPGVATKIMDAIRSQDLPVVQAGVCLLALCMITVRFLGDVLVVLLDPRLRRQSAMARAVSPSNTALHYATAEIESLDYEGTGHVANKSCMQRLKGSLLAGLGLLVIVAAVVFAPAVAPHNPLENHLKQRLRPPVWMLDGSPVYPLGTDQVGRDVLSRIIYSGRVSLTIGMLAMLLSAAFGSFLGLLAGYLGKVVDGVISTLAHIVSAFPAVLLALAVLAALGAGFAKLVLVLALTGWPLYTWTVRAQTMRLKEQEFVLSCQAAGMSHRRIVVSHIFPNLIRTILVIASLHVARLILLESFLNFLGLGLQPPTPTWGGMLGEGRQYMYLRWWLAVFPGLAIFLTALMLSVLGDGLQDWLDPRLKAVIGRNKTRLAQEHDQRYLHSFPEFSGPYGRL